MTYLPLETVYGPLVRDLPTDETGEFLLSGTNLPVPPRHLRADSIRASWMWHYYHLPVPRVDLLASKEALRQLGLLIFAKLFHPNQGAVTIHLGPSFRAEGVRLTSLVLNYSYEPTRLIGYSAKPLHFRYLPEKIQHAGWQCTQLPRVDFPQLVLQSADGKEFDIDRSHDAERVVGFGSQYGNALLAELLLDMGAPENEELEVALETDAGNGAVTADSAELRLILPGHPFYESGGSASPC